jgi:hypothetical protein
VSEVATLLDHENRRHAAVHLAPPSSGSAHRGRKTLAAMRLAATVRRAVRERFTAMADEDVDCVVLRACYAEMQP